MKLADLFNKSKPEPTEIAAEPALPLEELLKLAASDASRRAEFYQRILSDDLVALTNGTAFPEGAHVATEATRIQLRALPNGLIPIFTATERIFDGGVIKEQVDTIQLKGEDLFAMTRGARLVLNPYSGYGKEFLPEEVERMLDGTIMAPVHSQIRVEKETQVLIGQPSVYPTEMVDALKTLFATKEGVAAAYVAWIDNPESGDGPHYIFGVSVLPGVEIDPLMHDAGATVQHFDKPGGIVDFVVVDDQGGLSNYFLQTEPFYRK